MQHDIISKINSLADLIEKLTNADEFASEPSAEILRALEESGVFNLMAPASLGGLEAHPSVVFETLRRLSYFDGSVGWYCQAATTGVAVAGAFLGDRAVDEIFHRGKLATCAGQAAPSGKAERVGDGFRISGSFSFGSGIPNAAWVVGGYILHKDGAPVQRNGQPVMLIAVAPREKVEILGNWRVLGLRGTGSYDFRVPEQFIHADFAFDAADPVPRRGGALYSMGFTAIPALCHASFGLGCGARSLDEWARYAKSKARPQGGTVAEAETFRRDFAFASARMRGAKAFVQETFSRVFAEAEQGGVSATLRIDARLCASNAISESVCASQRAFTSSATTGLRDGNRIQRCFRDLQAANAHYLTAEQSWIDAGQSLIDGERSALES